MVQYIKKMLMTTILLGAWFLMFSSSSTFATSDGSLPFYDASQVPATMTDEERLNLATDITTNDLTTDDSAFAKIRDFFGLGTYTAQGQTTPALVYLKTIVNRLLGLVSLISLIMVIAAFYMIFFSKQEESVGKAKKMLIGVVIALAVMWLSRYIVSYFYNIYTVTTTTI